MHKRCEFSKMLRFLVYLIHLLCYRWWYQIALSPFQAVLLPSSCLLSPDHGKMASPTDIDWDKHWFSSANNTAITLSYDICDVGFGFIEPLRDVNSYRILQKIPRTNVKKSNACCKSMPNIKKSEMLDNRLLGQQTVNMNTWGGP